MGTWVLSENESDFIEIIKLIEELKERIYSTVGDDKLFNHLDGAIKRLKELSNRQETDPEINPNTMGAGKVMGKK